MSEDLKIEEKHENIKYTIILGHSV